MYYHYNFKNATTTIVKLLHIYTLKYYIICINNTVITDIKVIA